MKKTIIISGSILAALLVCTIIFIAVKLDARTNSETIYLNWGIEISKDYKEIYSIANEVSVLGDGERYHVFQNDDVDMIENDFDWEQIKNENIERMILSTTKQLPIKSDFKINFQSEYEYFHKVKNDNSKLFIVHILKSDIIYVIENFM